MKKEKVIKSTVSIVIVVAMLFCFAVSVSSSSPLLRLNNASGTSNVFSITSTGLAMISLGYDGYTGIATGATIEVHIEKKVWFWWSDVSGASWTDTLYGSYGDVYHEFQLSTKGDYRMVATYTIYGNGTENDVIPVTLYHSYD